MTEYFGKYMTFDTVSKKDGGALMGSDNIVGDIYTLKTELNDGIYKSWIINKFDAPIGFLNEADSREIALLEANNMQGCALLAFVAFSEDANDGHYWGQVAVIFYNASKKDVYENFIQGISKLIGEGIRPALDFDQEGVSHIESSDGKWIPEGREPMPNPEKGMVILKKRERFLDKVVEKGRTRNVGCYIASWIILLAVVALIIFGIYSCGFRG